MKIIVANWKMNNGFDETDKWLEEFLLLQAKSSFNPEELKVVVCSPNILLDYIDSELMEDALVNLEENMSAQKKSLEDFDENELNEIIIESRPISLGGQNCHFAQSGSYTGDVSAKMLKEVGCEYVILGHSERRENCFESDEIVAKKINSALSENLIPIICVGESKEIRDKNQHLEFIEKQILASISADSNFDKLIIAYEPIWAIGTGVVPDKLQILEVANLVQKLFTTKFQQNAKAHYLIYGGSVNGNNSSEILEIEGIDGLLVGKASLDALEFSKICGF